MGEVYRAHDERLERDVAVKVLPPEFADDEGRLERFAQEARSAGGLSHPNVLTVLDYGQVDGLGFVSTAFVQGAPLSFFVSEGRPMPLTPAFLLARQIAEGLLALALAVVAWYLRPFVGWLLWVLGAAMVAFGLFYLIRGLRSESSAD